VKKNNASAVHAGRAFETEARGLAKRSLHEMPRYADILSCRRAARLDTLIIQPQQVCGFPL
jgi:hypothetical protein